MIKYLRRSQVGVGRRRIKYAGLLNMLLFLFVWIVVALVVWMYSRLDDMSTSSTHLSTGSDTRPKGWFKPMFNQSGNIMQNAMNTRQTSGCKQVSPITASLGTPIPQANISGMDTGEIVVLDALETNSLQHQQQQQQQVEIVKNVAYCEDVETASSNCPAVKVTDLCPAPSPAKSPRLNSPFHSIHSQVGFSANSPSNRQPLFKNKCVSLWQANNMSKAFGSLASDLATTTCRVDGGGPLNQDTYFLKHEDMKFPPYVKGNQIKDPDSVGQAENLMALTNIGVGEVQHMTGGGGGSTQTSRSSVLRNNSVEQFSTTPKSLQPEKSPQCKTPTSRKALNNKLVTDNPKPETPNSISQISQVEEKSTVQNCSNVKTVNCILPNQVEEVFTSKIVAMDGSLTTAKEMAMVVCKSCGNRGRLHEKCDRCKKRITDTPKAISFLQSKKKLITCSVKKSDPPSAIEKNVFYPKKLTERVSSFNATTEPLKTTLASLSSNINCSPTTVKPIQYPRSRQAVRGRKSITIHNMKPPVPETVTISDDDEPAAAESSENQSKVLDPNSRISLNSNATNSSLKSDSPEENDRPDSPIFPAISTNLSMVNRSRCNRMEDELGNVVSRVGAQNMEVDEADESSLYGDPLEPAFNPDQLHFQTRNLRIGNVDISSPREVLLNSDCMLFKFTREDKPIEFKVFPLEFKSCEYNFVYRRPVVILHLTQSCAVRIESVLGLKFTKFCYDPNSSDATHRYIVMLLQPSSKLMMLKKPLIEIFQKFQKIQSQNKNSQEPDIFRAITIGEANQKLVECCPDLSQLLPLSSVETENPYPPSSFEAALSLYPDASPPINMGFSGPVENLITYPPPPAKGGITITNEDFFCLNEGEFLNDVIIDFFLKYLVLEKLSETDRERTHVFSSFFYKRLTQRLNRHSYSSDQDPYCSPMIKRHAQVKTWTRHVDIFQKDFIIVPINENAHWFLAIICFPGMEHPQAVRYLFLTSQDSSTLQKLNAHAEGTSDETNKLPIKLCDIRKESYTELYGFKQPCILIFDSLAGPSRTNVVKTLREYLQVEWDTRKKTPKRTFDKDFIKGGVPKVPQQNNYSDCGVYVLQYVESFFKNPIKDFTIPIRIHNWFSEEQVNSKRQEIQELIWNLKKDVDEKSSSTNKS
ncbi:sentrin-specific protease 6 isoform X3 [Octopus sinensis]|uniref:Sentrin-specific protease 6 isoform X3 n=1 Tax=Octopus sinensis TaxID=2607531 RepID=A0A7E6ELL9_9MOLL|nr:sentrin-specific protease 6 isoform X3 [Octopus sinensis]